MQLSHLMVLLKKSTNEKYMLFQTLISSEFGSECLGHYYLIFVADTGGAYDETDETNNNGAIFMQHSCTGGGCIYMYKQEASFLWFTLMLHLLCYPVIFVIYKGHSF